MLSKLRVLDLKENQLVGLPPSIGYCTSLVELHLGGWVVGPGPRLEALPGRISSLGSCRQVLLSRSPQYPPSAPWAPVLSPFRPLTGFNALTSLPDGVGACLELRSLDVR